MIEAHTENSKINKAFCVVVTLPIYAHYRKTCFNSNMIMLDKKIYAI